MDLRQKIMASIQGRVNASRPPDGSQRKSAGGFSSVSVSIENCRVYLPYVHKPEDLMKVARRITFLFLVILFACAPHGPEEKAEKIFKEGKNHLLVMHPTVQNLERLVFLAESGVFPLPDHYRIVGVYHEDANYDYSRSADFILQEEHGNMALFGLREPISEKDLFMGNQLTKSFGELFDQSDGVFFLGGPDIPPATYGEPFNLLTVVADPFRHYLELSFLFHLLGGSQDTTFISLLANDPDYMVLGICLGMQTMNVASGGSLIQDIPTEVYNAFTVEEVLAMDPDKQHRNYHSYYRLDPAVTTASFHSIHTGTESHMATIAGGPDLKPVVLSSHHQAISDMGMGYRATAWSEDGKIIEAIEHKSYPNVIGIQFHPEVPTLYDPDHKITFRPGETATHSFLELYPGPKGEDFHRTFWVHVAAMLP